MRPESRMRGKAGQKGSVVLEAMIAILIFSIGILGLIGMQTSAVSNVSDAKYRSDASFLADQIIGQMWASRVSSGGSFVVDTTYALPNPAPNPVVMQWAGSGVAGYLPNGTATITIDPANPQHVTVTLTWKPPKANPLDPAHVHRADAYIF